MSVMQKGHAVSSGLGRPQSTEICKCHDCGRHQIKINTRIQPKISYENGEKEITYSYKIKYQICQCGSNKIWRKMRRFKHF